MQELDGVLLIDKPEGMTSHDVVDRVRKKLGVRRVGHAGTLDPMATGLLMVCVGRVTRLLEYLGQGDKIYSGRVVLGIGTDTDDAEGTVVAEASAAHVNLAAVREAAAQLTGEIRQRPPQYSAIHIDGRRAYDLAREGKKVEIPERTVRVEAFTIDALSHEGDLAVADFHVRCSKGTYVRALCRDLGALLGVPAHMRSLRRLGIGRARIEDAIPLSDWLASDSPAAHLRDPLLYLEGLPMWHPPREAMERLANGQKVEVPEADALAAAPGDVVLVVYAGAVAAVGEIVEGPRTAVRPKKVFWKRG
ncbi:tRNA pseudouridine(55) synthase TruB [Alicyclobacillus vulcanalis]|uniref:tRNA pseudouridine synthase B n=1 Tax=Alicyclobacillus vulcanalis TaxID=252246 RepID=A0A1N7MV32_9BACL|nr:tRNA pseudouridine(55) synthase TruB [Alicyclobacillus vulcanalis]SIS89922.1 tRNA pseudouridine synthase B [Alicyclobacillus vulcanalis]